MGGNMTGAGRYKLIRLLNQADGFSCYAALDIETPLRENVLLNRYTGAEEIRRMVPLCYPLSTGICPSFVRVFTEDSCFTAVFALKQGEAFADYFAAHKSLEGELRQAYTETLLHAALENAQMPGELLSACLCEENVVVQEKNKRLCLNFCLPPKMEEEPVALRLSPLVEKTLRRKWTATDEQIDWMDGLQNGGFDSVSALYSAWRALVPKMESDRASKNALGKLLRFCKRKIRTAWKNWKKKRAEKKRQMREMA